MSTRYADPSVRLEGRRVLIHCRVENRTQETWMTSGGFAIGCQILDRETGAYVGEGPWIPVLRDVPPGGSATVDIEAELPRGNGQYRLVVSPVDSTGGWRFRAHWPAFVVEADLAGGETTVLSTRVATDRTLSRERWPRSLSRAFAYPVDTVWSNWPLIRSMVRRDILARYRGSLGDALWTVINPLLLMSTYFFVFGVVLKSRFPGDPSQAGFVLYFLAGMLPWLAVSEAIGRSALVVVEHRNFVKKLLFPVEILPVNMVIAGLVTEVFALLVFMVGLLLARGHVPLTVLWLPVILGPQILLTVGICWFLAALGVYMRDLGQIIGFVLTLWFFLTPICYPEAQLPATLAPFLSLNPMYGLVTGYRRIFLEARAPLWPMTAWMWLYASLLCVLGHAWFYKLRKGFADII
jgi:lipopolysaccharide transport system permease protein